MQETGNIRADGVVSIKEQIGGTVEDLERDVMKPVKADYYFSLVGGVPEMTLSDMEREFNTGRISLSESYGRSFT